ncbi:3-deoxy-D-manno-octulosonic acid transferase [Tropicimonas sp. IMCC34043]|uniref:3-deoxy-D-manno-octulosonic acid transferase n=1 Tax=Tropicimonas sp. IMCC34043 TaxID=2248760 RepID=UPI00130079FA|nr:glycosyltransferase N-terminal domain-containing protein [Tropicimonas sp. IMCC34043]
MEIPTLPTLKDRVRGPTITRRLHQQVQRGGDEGRLAAERLGQSDVPRPDGPVIWLHAPDGLAVGAIESLVNRLVEMAPDASVLVTAPPGQQLPTGVDIVGIVHQSPPLDSAKPVEQFLDHWRPDVGIWFDRIDAPLLLDRAASQEIPLFFQNAVLPRLRGPRARNAHRRLLGLFESVLVPDTTESERIRSLGALTTRIEITGRLSHVATPLDYVESERNALARALRARPIWLASCPTPDEIAPILAAHREAQRIMHRLLLIIVPSTDAQAPALAEEFSAQGWRVARRDANEDPEESTEIFLADLREELGLFYRLAPVSLLGGTFSKGEVPPAMEPAALGSAIIAGPHFGRQAEALGLLHAAGAARILTGPNRLGAAVADLMAPERAAQMALRGWDVASDGAQVLERLMALVAHVLPKRRT